MKYLGLYKKEPSGYKDKVMKNMYVKKIMTAYSILNELTNTLVNDHVVSTIKELNTKFEYSQDIAKVETCAHSEIIKILDRAKQDLIGLTLDSEL